MSLRYLLSISSLRKLLSKIYFELNVTLKRISKMTLAFYQNQLRSDHYYESLPEVVVVVVVEVVVVVLDDVIVIDVDIVHGS